MHTKFNYGNICRDSITETDLQELEIRTKVEQKSTAAGFSRVSYAHKKA